MKLDFLKDSKFLCFAAGAAAVIAGKQVLKSKKVREVCVSGIAKGMMLKADAEEALKNVKEDAEDLCYEARSKINSDMEEAD